MKPIRIFTPVFGKKHISWLDRVLGTSFNWPKNKSALREAQWTLFIHSGEFEQVMTVVTKILPEQQIETIECHDNLDLMTAKRGVLMCEAFVKAMRACLKDGRQLLISTPDFIWADGTIANMRQLAQNPNTCVSLPHPRVTPSIIEGLTKPLNSPELVNLFEHHAHRAWITSELGKHSGSMIGGILWQRLNGVITLQHRMPSPYLLNLIPSDLDYFTTTDPQRLAAWGAIDHTWAVHLCESERWRMLLSSDLGFMCEVTEPGDNIPKEHQLNTQHPDDFWKQERNDHLLHQKLNRQYVATFRGGTGYGISS